jgi:hypothetical protein
MADWTPQDKERLADQRRQRERAITSSKIEAESDMIFQTSMAGITDRIIAMIGELSK